LNSSCSLAFAPETSDAIALWELTPEDNPELQNHPPTYLYAWAWDRHTIETLRRARESGMENQTLTASKIKG
jgi:hypothetical protein